MKRVRYVGLLTAALALRVFFAPLFSGDLPWIHFLSQSVVILGLIYAALCGLIIMSWTTRRLRAMTAKVAELAAGDLSILRYQSGKWTTPRPAGWPTS